MKNLTISFFVLFFIGCQSNTDNKNNSTEQSTNLEVSSHNSCLLDFSTHMNDLLDKKSVASIFNIEPENIEMRFNKMKKPESTNLQFEWEEGRKLRMKSGLELPLKNSLYIGYIKELASIKESNISSREAFRNMYRVRTEKEIEELKEAFRQKAKDENISDEGSASGSQMIESAMKVEYETVKSLGDEAVWRNYPEASGGGGELIILLGNYTFGVNLNVSDNQEENKLKAISIAKNVLSQCSK